MVIELDRLEAWYVADGDAEAGASGAVSTQELGMLKGYSMPGELSTRLEDGRESGSKSQPTPTSGVSAARARLAQQQQQHLQRVRDALPPLRHAGDNAEARPMHVSEAMDFQNDALNLVRTRSSLRTTESTPVSWTRC